MCTLAKIGQEWHTFQHLSFRERNGKNAVKWDIFAYFSYTVVIFMTWLQKQTLEKCAMMNNIPDVTYA